MRTIWKKYGFALTTALTLTIFTGYGLLDTFVIPHSYAEAAVQAEVATASSLVVEEEDTVQAEVVATSDLVAEEEDTVQDEVVVTSDSSVSEEDTSSIESDTDTLVESETTTSSSDETSNTGGEVTSETALNLMEYRVNDTTIYVADIALGSGQSIQTALAGNTYGRNIKASTSEIAYANNALLAINGDFYGARDSGYVIRNGVLYRDTSAGNEDLVIYADGRFEIIQEDEVTAAALLEAGAQQVFSFGPALVENGEIAVTENEEVGKAMASNPRTAIGILENGHYVLVVSDGRTSESEGLSLRELAEFLQELGAVTAYNLDGGGSSTMVYNGEVINNPTTVGKHIKERSVSDIVYISATYTA